MHIHGLDDQYTEKTQSGDILIVGSPGYRTSLGTVGRVYGFNVSSITSYPATLYTNQSLFSITGYQALAKAGFAVSAGTPWPGIGAVLALSLPTTNNTVDIFGLSSGTVVVVPISSLHGDMSLETLPYKLVLMSENYGSRFGWNILFDDVNQDGYDDMIVTAPQFDGDSGAVALWYGGASFPSGIVFDALNSNNNNWMATGVKGSKGRFGSSVVAWDYNGDGKKEIVIGEPRAVGMGTFETAGSVHVFSCQ